MTDQIKDLEQRLQDAKDAVKKAEQAEKDAKLAAAREAKVNRALTCLSLLKTGVQTKRPELTFTDLEVRSWDLPGFAGGYSRDNAVRVIVEEERTSGTWSRGYTGNLVVCIGDDRPRRYKVTPTGTFNAPGAAKAYIELVDEKMAAAAARKKNMALLRDNLALAKSTMIATGIGEYGSKGISVGPSPYEAGKVAVSVSTLLSMTPEQAKEFIARVLYALEAAK